MQPPGISDSNSPALASRYAVVRPLIPPPTTTTSASVSSLSWGYCCFNCSVPQQVLARPAGVQQNKQSSCRSRVTLIQHTGRKHNPKAAMQRMPSQTAFCNYSQPCSGPVMASLFLHSRGRCFRRKVLQGGHAATLQRTLGKRDCSQNDKMDRERD
jgi:hypothetical protein